MNINARHAKDRAYKFEEARWLMSYRVHPDRLVDQLGTTRHALDRLARRWDAPDIAAYVNEPKVKTVGECATCGVPTSRRECTACPQCANVLKWAAA